MECNVGEDKVRGDTRTYARAPTHTTHRQQLTHTCVARHMLIDAYSVNTHTDPQRKVCEVWSH